MRFSKGQMLVPTLEIDLVWHSHLFCPKVYKKDVIKITGRMINHDDSVESDNLNHGFAFTQELWNSRRRFPYIRTRHGSASTVVDFDHIPETGDLPCDNYADCASSTWGANCGSFGGPVASCGGGGDGDGGGGCGGCGGD
eukprot:TRINITY_DN1677_c0_g1_i2.p1 TRINITY_DN1677_c0_g1~~TRINITY_DN1677_c0_g1_i2.p1  ORF type:complete len:140 (+),score=61.44 TRINITY_DN1677_c0_g1_i2:581-1000(+)